jgi:hypothetical protein
MSVPMSALLAKQFELEAAGSDGVQKDGMDLIIKKRGQGKLYYRIGTHHTSQRHCLSSLSLCLHPLLANVPPCGACGSDELCTVVARSSGAEPWFLDQARLRKRRRPI